MPKITPKRNGGTDLEWLQWMRNRVQNILLESDEGVLAEFDAVLLRLNLEYDRRHGRSNIVPHQEQGGYS